MSRTEASGERLSQVLHRRVLELLRRDPERVIAHGRARLTRMWDGDADDPAAALWQAWQDALDEGPAAVEAILTGTDPQAVRLRRASPFAGLIDPRERWALWREVTNAS